MVASLKDGRSRGFSVLKSKDNCPEPEQCTLLLWPITGRRKDVSGLRRPIREMPRPSTGRSICTSALAARWSPVFLLLVIKTPRARGCVLATMYSHGPVLCVVVSEFHNVSTMSLGGLIDLIAEVIGRLYRLYIYEYLLNGPAWRGLGAGGHTVKGWRRPQPHEARVGGVSYAVVYKYSLLSVSGQK